MVRSRNFAIAFVAVVVSLTLGFLCIPKDSQASAILKSKSNISNNRQIGQTSGPGTAILLCESCSFDGLAEESHLILMDSLTGDVWAYSDAAVVGQADPVYVGTLSAVGKRITKKVQPPNP